MEIIRGLGLLLLVLTLFAIFSLYAPKGQKAMSGLANAAVATFLVEAILKYVLGITIGIEFFKEIGEIVGGMGGVASASLVMLGMGSSPVLAISTGLAMYNFGILPGFIAGYILSFLSPFFDNKLPDGIGHIVGVLVLATMAYLIGSYTDPFIKNILNFLQGMILEASNQSPLVMGILLGGIMKMICTSPLSSMALTAMLGLTGLPMGIASIACFGGAFADGITFFRFKMGNKLSFISVMLEPLTQAPIITSNPLPIFTGSFLGGALAGISAVIFNIVNDAPGTASPIPGILVPFGFNEPYNVLMAGLLAIVGGVLGGLISTTIMMKMKMKINRF